MASAIPGGVPGYDDNKELGNNITHLSDHLPKDCANIATKPVKSRQALFERDFWSLAGFRQFGEREFAAIAQKARGARLPTNRLPFRGAANGSARTRGPMAASSE